MPHAVMGVGWLTALRLAAFFAALKHALRIAALYKAAAAAG